MLQCQSSDEEAPDVTDGPSFYAGAPGLVDVEASCRIQ
jgi:hypothetical protein